MATVASKLGSAVRMEVEAGIARIRLNQPDRPVNVLSRQLMAELEEVIGQLERGSPDVQGAVLLSDKPGVWIAGADIEEFHSLQTADEGERLSRFAQQLLNRLEGVPVPVVAAIDGVALGGGLELALACTYRIATDSPKTKLGFPEVQLGLLPGAGGTQRLPRLIGLRSGLELMLTGKQLDARRARKVGLVDEVVPASAVERAAVQIARQLAEGQRRPRAGRPRGSPQWIENLPGARTFIFSKARQGVLQKTHGLYPAPLRILEVVARGIDQPLSRALEYEARVFGELSVTPESLSLVYVFETSTAAKNDARIASEAPPGEVDRVAIVGAGFMGAGIAAAVAESGQRVRLKDVSPDAVARGIRTARDSLRKRAERRRRPRHEITALLDRLEGTAEYTGLRNIPLVVEAVFEDLELKHGVLKEIEAAAGPEVIIGSNTSTIPITRLAEALARPERVIGLHFFSPVEKMPLLEIIVTPDTDPQAAVTCHRWGKRIGKTPIVVNDGPGFYVNRILGPYMNEAARLLEEGVAIEAIDRAMVSWGFPVGPLTLFDEVGLEVAAKSGRILAEAFPERMQPNHVLQALLEDGRQGRKNGRGFYRYEAGKRVGPDETVYALIGAPDRGAREESGIQERLVLGLINEAVRCLEDGVLRSVRDGDVGAVFGIGFPPFRGGPFRYLNQIGPATVLERLRALEARHGPRFTPPPLLVRRAAAGERFEDET